ncbi:deoxyribose-phosphate aldolase [Rufibacter radiotolerans]|uniref:Deoxyribose-phosphate aldolase n=1 Tax=Rufibacter radiotolerans TaxID=1379910 RepID=A0A0H4VTY3_9BACT|nr:deoxyribose-phosphate aldolase [Rufibacter radiotolerans]AKQ47407.1 deoxyribose-phosphate aldolase [Rufibacter radiotolerans]
MQTEPEQSLAPYIDHTVLRPDTTQAMVEQLCQEAAQHHFAAVCVPPCFVKQAVAALQDTGVQIATVVGFPLGYQLAKVKFFEAHQALTEGATEIDVVMNIAAFKSGKHDEVMSELQELSTLCHFKNAILKVIIETALLSPEEIVQVCNLCVEAEADFVKTSTGFAASGAKVEDILLMRSTLPAHIRIKASGGIKTKDAALALVKAGADRIGTSSGVSLL